MAGLMSAKDLQVSFTHTGAPQVVDVRSATEFATGHIPGAMNIPLEQFEARLDDIDVARPIVLVCQGGQRATLCAQWLAHRADVSILEGGTSAWQRAGLPIVRCVPCRWSLERQVRLIAGLIVLVGTLLSVTVAQPWVYLAMFVGAGLTFAGLTNICGMAFLLVRMPWNRNTRTGTAKQEIAANYCS